MVRRPSSFTIVPTPDGSLIVALMAEERLTANASFGSLTVSPFTRTVTCLPVSPGLNVRVVSGSAV
jgi:hypothetical protein